MFLLPDELFVSEAFLRTLGRPADPAGFRAYLEALRTTGLSRTRLVLDLQRSQEASRLSDPPPHKSVAADLWPHRSAVKRHGLRRPAGADLMALRDDLFAQACIDYFGTPPAPGAEVGQRAAAIRHGRRSAGWPRRWWPALQPWRRPAPPRAAPGPERSHPVVAPDASRWAGTAFLTIATASYLPFVRVLMESLQRQHPVAQRVLLLVDESPVPVDLPGVEVVAAAALGIPCFDDMSMRYEVTELSTALKPFVIRWLFQHSQLDRIVYLDPDTRCEAPLAPVFEALDDGGSVTLTPHVLQPLPEDGLQPDDHTVLRSGVFNLGFVGFRRCNEALVFLDWWARRLETGALIDFSANLFTDQRWCDLAPAFLPNLRILRDPGLNVAYWNLPQRRLDRTAGAPGWTAQGQLLRFFHFSGVDPTDPTTLSRFQTRALLQEQPALQGLLEDYAAAVRRAGWADSRRLRWRYASEAGVEISPTLRRMYRRWFPTPSRMSREQAVSAMMAACEVEPDTGLSPLMRDLHSMRDDLRSQFDLSRPRDRSAYQGWFWSVGIVEHGFESLLRSRLTARHG